MTQISNNMSVESLSKEDFKEVLEYLDTDYSGKNGFEEFKIVFKRYFKCYD